MRIRLLLIIVFVIKYSITYCQQDSAILLKTYIVQIDSSSLLEPLLDTILAMDSDCQRGSCHTNFLYIASSMESEQLKKIEIINGDCLSPYVYLSNYSIKGISYYKNKEIIWLNEVPLYLNCYIKEQQVSITYFIEEDVPIRDNVPTTYCYYNYGQFFIYKRTGCLNFNNGCPDLPTTIQK